MDIKELEQIITILKNSGVTEFELSRGDVHIKLSREMLGAAAPAYVPVQAAVPHAAPVAASPAANVATNGAIPSNFVKVESPIVGTFYRKPSPDAEPFVKEGDRVEKGDTLCIIEAMKLMNEIEAPRSGRVEKVFLTDGNVVEFGEMLYLINPDA
jgi:acetyl-CoA carboxylase biotin carboxyl carrier protein